MADKKTEEKKSTLPSKSNFSEWYNELLLMGEIMDVRYPVKGLYVWFPLALMCESEPMPLSGNCWIKTTGKRFFPCSS